MILVTVLLTAFVSGKSCFGGLRVGTVAYPKGQEVNTIHGFGLVVGLNGTGDQSGDFMETARSLGKLLELSGHQSISPAELSGVSNVAIVSVTATIPPEGVREGGLLDCRVASIANASSLEGGQLLVTSMIGPTPAVDPSQAIVYAQANGLLVVDPENPTTAKITKGCRMLQDFFNPYVKDGIITLVLHENHADWRKAQAVAIAVNEVSGMEVARAANQQNVLVKMPVAYQEDPVPYIADILDQELFDADSTPRIVINERSGVIVVDEGVEIAPMTITHKGLVIQVGGQNANQEERFVNIDPEAELNNEVNPKLEALQKTLNQVKVPPEDMIEIFKMIDQTGKLYGQLVIE
jgi:flagellar P-ring protein precursor FlgI